MSDIKYYSLKYTWIILKNKYKLKCDWVYTKTHSATRASLHTLKLVQQAPNDSPARQSFRDPGR